MHGSATPIENVPEGMVQVKYIGSSWGLINISGPITRTPYRVSLGHPYVLAHENDLDSRRSSVPGLCQMVRAGVRQFEMYEQKKTAAEDDVVSLDPEGDLDPDLPEDDQGSEDEPHPDLPDPEGDPPSEPDSDLPDPTKMQILTKAEILAIPTDVGYDFATALESEREGKNRKTVIEYLEGIVS